MHRQQLNATDTVALVPPENLPRFTRCCARLIRAYGRDSSTGPTRRVVLQVEGPTDQKIPAGTRRRNIRFFQFHPVRKELAFVPSTARDIQSQVAAWSLKDRAASDYPPGGVVYRPMCDPVQFAKPSHIWTMSSLFPEMWNRCIFKG